jgi:DNA-directed RNA polymerase subunit A"
MTIYLEPEYAKNKEKALKIAKKLIDVRIADVINVKENYEKKTITIEMDKQKAEERDVDMKELEEKIIKTMKQNCKKNKNTLTITAKTDILKTRKTLQKMQNTRIQGIKGIEKTILTEENKEHIIKTRGTNIKAVLKLPEIDATRTTTNDIKEIATVLGIEAGRTAIIKELTNVLKENNIAVDIRHIMLLADIMCYTGDIKGIVRTGITREKSSPFSRAAFEETVKHLIDAAFKGEKEKLEGVVENIIVGQPIKVGTGTVELQMKEK